LNGPTVRRLDRLLFVTFGGREVRISYPTEIQSECAEQFLTDKLADFEKNGEVRVFGDEQSRIRFIHRFLDIISNFFPHIQVVDSLSQEHTA
jgi:hypothetical protein